MDDINKEKINESELLLYKKLTKQNEKYSRDKNFFVFFSVIVIILVLLSFSKKELDILNYLNESLVIIDYILAGLIACILYQLLTKWARRSVYKTVTNGIYPSEKKCDWKKVSWKRLFKIIVTPDYYYADIYKTKLKNFHAHSDNNTDSTANWKDVYDHNLTIYDWDSIKIRMKYYLIHGNWLNLIISLLFTLALLILLRIYVSFPSIIIFIALLILSFMLIYRLISRTIEIGYAFFKDVVAKREKIFSKIPRKILIKQNHLKVTNYKNHFLYLPDWKNSYLLRGNRISLAVHSLFEIIILYMSVSGIILLLNHSEAISKLFLQAFLYSITTFTMNIVFPVDNLICLALLHTMQLIVTLTLIVFSIATYIGDNKEMPDREKDLYIYYKQENKEEDKA